MVVEQLVDTRWSFGGVGNRHGESIKSSARTGARLGAPCAAPWSPRSCDTITAMTTSHVAATVPLPPPVARPQDAQLRQDVRWLAATLGRVVGRLAGDGTLRAVYEVRPACRARPPRLPGGAGPGGL